MDQKHVILSVAVRGGMSAQVHVGIHPPPCEQNDRQV